MGSFDYFMLCSGAFSSFLRAFLAQKQVMKLPYSVFNLDRVFASLTRKILF